MEHNNFRNRIIIFFDLFSARDKSVIILSDRFPFTYLFIYDILYSQIGRSETTTERVILNLELNKVGFYQHFYIIFTLMICLLNCVIKTLEFHNKSLNLIFSNGMICIYCINVSFIFT